jgi:Spy/CpxP family protein refolding chaperone
MKRRIGIIIAILSVMLVGIPLLRAQQPPQPADQLAAPRPPQPPMDPLGDVMFPPDLIMGHARELGLTDEQKAFMRGEIQKTTARFLELQWQLQDAVESLHQTMKSNAVDEPQALAQLDKVLDTERQVKRLHFSLGIRLKNQLTAEQQGKLRAMRIAPSSDAQPRPGEEL